MSSHAPWIARRPSSWWDTRRWLAYLGSCAFGLVEQCGFAICSDRCGRGLGVVDGVEHAEIVELIEGRPAVGQRPRWRRSLAHAVTRCRLVVRASVDRSPTTACANHAVVGETGDDGVTEERAAPALARTRPRSADRGGERSGTRCCSVRPCSADGRTRMVAAGDTHRPAEKDASEWLLPLLLDDRPVELAATDFAGRSRARDLDCRGHQIGDRRAPAPVGVV